MNCNGQRKGLEVTNIDRKELVELQWSEERVKDQNLEPFLRDEYTLFVYGNSDKNV